jgi:negative regulator of flagellin synthesis FlgM
VSSKIGGVNGGSPSGAVGAGRSLQRPQDAANGSAAGANASNGSNENVRITGAARQLANLEQAVRDLPVVNDSKVAQISNAIEQGTYSINTRHIANQLVEMEKALNGLADPSGADPDPGAE